MGVNQRGAGYGYPAYNYALGLNLDHGGRRLGLWLEGGEERGVFGFDLLPVETFTVREIAVGRELDPGVLEDYKRDGLSRGLIGYFDSFFIHICVNLSKGGGTSAVPG